MLISSMKTAISPGNENTTINGSKQYLCLINLCNRLLTKKLRKKMKTLIQYRLTAFKMCNTNSNTTLDTTFITVHDIRVHTRYRILMI